MEISQRERAYGRRKVKRILRVHILTDHFECGCHKTVRSRLCLSLTRQFLSRLDRERTHVRVSKSDLLQGPSFASFFYKR